MLELEQLRDENDRLREQIKLLHKAIMGDEPGWSLVGKRLACTPQQCLVLRVLYRREVATFEQILMAMYSARPSADFPDPKIVHVHICNIRRKLGPTSIDSVWGRGYVLAPEFRRKIMGWLREAERGSVGGASVQGDDDNGRASQGRHAAAVG